MDPLISSKAQLDARIASAKTELENDDRLFDLSRRVSRVWQEMTSQGLKRDESEAQLQFQKNVTDWAQDAALSLPSVKPERTEKENDFYRYTLRATGTGTMSQIGRFLWHVTTASVPVRINDLTITSRKEGTDDLQVSIGLSTIYLMQPADKEKNARPAAALSAEAAW